MYGGTMDRETVRLAQEQMSRIPPEELMRMQEQMMSNPELLRMATEGMKNLRPEDVRFAAEQMKHLRPEDMAEMSARMAQASPEEIAGMRARSEVQHSYAFQGALNLKNQGNQLHGVGQYLEAAEKYQRAKSNLAGIFSSEAAGLRLACSLNLMSCYLKTKEYEKTIAEGSEVLEYDTKNLKALYRRGQAYKELGKLKSAVADLVQAAEIAPDDETVGEVLRKAKEDLEHQGDEEAVAAEEEQLINGPIIEEISEEEAANFCSNIESSNGGKPEQTEPKQFVNGQRKNSLFPENEAFSETLSILKQNPDMIRSMHTMMSCMNPEQIASMTGGDMTPEMAKLASNTMKQMSPEDLQRMVDMAGTLKRQGVVTGSRPTERISREHSISNVSPSTSASVGRETDKESSQEEIPMSNSRSGAGLYNRPSVSPDMQEHMRQQMKDPAMKEMMAAMMKNMTPETMASMSQQMGMKLSPEEALQAQTAMANLSLDDLDRLMRWADRAQRMVEHVKKTKRFFLGMPGLILAVLILIIAVVLHYLGYIGG